MKFDLIVEKFFLTLFTIFLNVQMMKNMFRNKKNTRKILH